MTRETRHEAAKAYVVQSYENLMKADYIDRKEWVYTGDHKNDSEHCRNHAQLSGVVIPKGDLFTLVGLDGQTYQAEHPQDPALLDMLIRGDGFLYNMARIAAGTLLYAGLGKIPPHSLPGILRSRDRTRAGRTMPPEGLTLMEVRY